MHSCIRSVSVAGITRKLPLRLPYYTFGESAVLGLVGCAGIGFYIELYRRSFNYPRVCTMVLITMLIVMCVDQLSVQIRKRLA